MIYPLADTKVHYLDLDTGEQGLINITDLLSKYFHSVTDVQGNHQFSFSANIGIRSWNGWTKLKAIKKIPVDLTKKYYLINHITDIVLSEDHILPIYSRHDIDNPVFGFHGHTDYNYTSMEFSKCFQNDSKNKYMRFYISPTNNGFISPYIENFDHIIEGTNCYEIITESKFFNLGNFYLF